MPISLTVTRAQEHSPPLSGTYQVLIGGTPIEYNGNPNFDYNSNYYSLRSAIRDYYDSDEIEVYDVMYTWKNMNIKYIIHYNGLRQTPDPITFELINLSGGRAGTSPTGTIIPLRIFSETKPLFSPVPMEFLRVPSEIPSLVLTVNGIFAICEDCSYEFLSEKTPILDSITYNSPTIESTISFSSASIYTVSDIEMSLLDVSCDTLTGTET